jgi:hypothetical protein
MTDDGDAEGWATDALDQQRQVDNVPYATGNLEITLDVHKGESVPPAGDQFGVVETEFLIVPILDQAVEHIEIMREVDNACRIAMGKPDWNASREGSPWWQESILDHVTISCCKTSL